MPLICLSLGLTSSSVQASNKAILGTFSSKSHKPTTPQHNDDSKALCEPSLDILLTNDDGFDTPGIVALQRALFPAYNHPI